MCVLYPSLSLTLNIKVLFVDVLLNYFVSFDDSTTEAIPAVKQPSLTASFLYHQEPIPDGEDVCLIFLVRGIRALSSTVGSPTPATGLSCTDAILLRAPSHVFNITTHPGMILFAMPYLLSPKYE